MRDPVAPGLILAHADQWRGTPFRRGAALRGAGCDCIGLIRGIFAELCGYVPAVPPWRDDWAVTGGEPILRGLAAHMIAKPGADARPGDVVTWRIGSCRAAHAGILTRRGVLHAGELAGVSEVPALTGRASGPAFAFPAPDLCLGDGTDDLTPADCMAMILPAAGDDDPAVCVEVARAADGTPLARSAPFTSVAQALAMARPVYSCIESVR